VSHIRELSVDASPPLPLHLNGDFVGQTPLRVWVRAGGLRVLVPRAHTLARRADSAPPAMLAAE
jgi:diacylglycerol kinase family enzyme